MDSSFLPTVRAGCRRLVRRLSDKARGGGLIEFIPLRRPFVLAPRHCTKQTVLRDLATVESHVWRFPVRFGAVRAEHCIG
jgi:hypothetical protein